MSTTDPQSLEYVVTFGRIGRHGGGTPDGPRPPAPAPLVRIYGGERLARDIATYARRFLGSPSFEVVLDGEAGNGAIYAGFRTAGTFTIDTRPRGSVEG
ncbi:hypothetical protein [Streptomyces sp. TRM68367]|uniref:hypothetical protein n=1 Tax=Streptomyces sp. TRM68367 TaxID=2758415 RepID=UPI00165BA993|nr:hypothetical protein [Streptomyces sp. TRM68367]MBC9730713.1 hypothetical protein [Streptomyces sp. TRM68367]